MNASEKYGKAIELQCDDHDRLMWSVEKAGISNFQLEATLAVTTSVLTACGLLLEILRHMDAKTLEDR